MQLGYGQNFQNMVVEIYQLEPTTGSSYFVLEGNECTQVYAGNPIHVDKVQQDMGFAQVVRLSFQFAGEGIPFAGEGNDRYEVIVFYFRRAMKQIHDILLHEQNKPAATLSLATTRMMDGLLPRGGEKVAKPNHFDFRFGILACCYKRTRSALPARVYFRPHECITFYRRDDSGRRFFSANFDAGLSRELR
jgi:hypothetical protein